MFPFGVGHILTWFNAGGQIPNDQVQRSIAALDGRGRAGLPRLAPTLMRTCGDDFEDELAAHVAVVDREMLVVAVETHRLWELSRRGMKP